MRLGRMLALALVLLCLAAVVIYVASVHSGFGIR